MKRFLTFLAAPPALMTLLLIGQIAGNGVEDDCPDPTCKTPNPPFYENIDYDNVTVWYIYNETSRLCRKILIEEGKNTFHSRFSCVSKCKTGQGSPYCVGPPVNAVNGSITTSSVASTLGIQESDPAYQTLTEEFEAFFYNATSRQCENYTCYGMPDRDNVTNFFTGKETCVSECR
uniref:Putative monolaris n=1 Tax=Rhipicephalus pulchellus TaxID=72859 RepID=L7M8T8_RHIPC